MQWYSDPRTYTAIGALIISLLAWRATRRAIHVSVEQRILQLITEINEWHAKYRVRGVYAHRLGIPDDPHAIEVFAGKAAVFLQQASLLRAVARHRKEIKVVDHYENWATTLLRPWIESDGELRKLRDIFCETGDLDRKQDQDWLNRQLGARAGDGQSSKKIGRRRGGRIVVKIRMQGRRPLIIRL